jgi:hypothetical protein
MAPNRAKGARKGFTVFETDGKLRKYPAMGDSHPIPQLARDDQAINGQQPAAAA